MYWRSMPRGLSCSPACVPRRPACRFGGPSTRPSPILPLALSVSSLILCRRLSASAMANERSSPPPLASFSSSTLTRHPLLAPSQRLRRLLPCRAAAHNCVRHGRQPSRSLGHRRTSTRPGCCALPRRERSPAAGALWPPSFARLVLVAHRAPQRLRRQSTCSRAACTRGQPSTLLLRPSRGHHRVRTGPYLLPATRRHRLPPLRPDSAKSSASSATRPR